MSDVLELLGEDTNIYQATIQSALDKRTLIFNSQVDDSIIEDFIIHIIWWNKEDEGLPRENRKPIKIIINSPGGDAIVGSAFCDIIEQSETPVIGIGIGLVASASYYIFLACHERICTSHTVILQHDGYVGVSDSTSKARDAMNFYSLMEKKNKEYVLSHTTMTEEYYDSNYEKELYLYPEQAAELGIVDKILGIDIGFDEVF